MSLGPHQILGWGWYRLICLNPPVFLFTDHSKAVLLLLTLLLFLFHASSLLYCLVCSLQLYDQLLGKLLFSWLFCVRYVIVFLSLFNMVSQVRCDTWLYRFLIFAFFFTFISLCNSNVYQYNSVTIWTLVYHFVWSVNELSKSVNWIMYLIDWDAYVEKAWGDHDRQFSFRAQE